MTRTEFFLEFSYYLQRHGITHFRAYECCDVGRVKMVDGVAVTLQAPPRELWENMLPTLEVQEWLRAQTGVPTDVSSGYRSPAYNEAVGGAPLSTHKVFNAMDSLPRGWSPLSTAVKLLDHPQADRMGLGLYSTFVHVDTRGLIGRVAPARWGTPDKWWEV